MLEGLKTHQELVFFSSALKSSWRIVKYNHGLRTVCMKRNFERKEQSNREGEKREKREERNDFLFFLNSINWDYIHIYNAIA